MCLTTLFIIGKVLEQLKCPSTDKWIKNMWYRLYGVLVRLNNIAEPKEYYAK